MVCGRIIHFTHQNMNKTRWRGTRKQRGEVKCREVRDVPGSQQNGVWKDEESILPRLLIPGSLWNL
jgi:hypothetical protein